MRIFLTIVNVLWILVQAEAAIPKTPAAALKDIKRQYKSIKTFHCEFTEQFQWQLTGELVTRTGTLVSAEADRFRMETPEQTIVSDGVNLYRHNKLKNQVMIESVNEASQLLPRRLLLDLGGEFDATGLSPIPILGQEGFRLDLKPLKSDESLLSTLSVWVTTADLIIHKLQIDDLNGNRTTYILQNIRLDAPVEPDKTTFIIPEGADLFDLR